MERVWKRTVEGKALSNPPADIAQVQVMFITPQVLLVKDLVSNPSQRVERNGEKCKHRFKKITLDEG